MAKIIPFKSCRDQRDQDENALQTLDYSILQIAMNSDLSNVSSMWSRNQEFLNEHSFILGIFPRNSFKIFFYEKQFNKEAYVKTFRYYTNVPVETKMLELRQWLLKIFRQMQPAATASNFLQHVLNWHKCLAPCLENKKMIISDYDDSLTHCKAIMALTTHTKGAYLIPRYCLPEEPRRA